MTGHGPLDSRIALIGEHPGTEELRLDLPMVGASGALLNELLAKVGIHRALRYSGGEGLGVMPGGLALPGGIASPGALALPGGLTPSSSPLATNLESQIYVTNITHDPLGAKDYDSAMYLAPVAKRQPTPTNEPIKNGPEIVNFRPVP